MADKRYKNSIWAIYTNADDSVQTDFAQLAVLMDIRDELQAIRRQVECRNVQAEFIAMRKTASLLNARLPVKKRKARK